LKKGSDFYPPQYVENFVTNLRNRYRGTTDYINFNNELESIKESN